MRYFKKLLTTDKITRRSLLSKGSASLLSLFFLPKVSNAIYYKPQIGYKGQSESKTIDILQWGSTISADVIYKYQLETGNKIRSHYFESTDNIVDILGKNNLSIDLLFSSNTSLSPLIKNKLIQPIDKDSLKNYMNLFDTSFNSGDISNKYSIPYMWGTIGIAYDKKQVSRTPNSWLSMYNSSVYKGQIGLLNKPQYLIRLGLKSLGFSLNDTSSKHLKQVHDMLIGQKKYINTFHEHDTDLLLNTKISLMQEFNGLVNPLIKANSNIDFVIPKQGSLLWTDNLVVPRSSTKKKVSTNFLDYLLRADVATKVFRSNHYATTNKAAYDMLGDKYKNNKIIFPDQAQLVKSEVMEDLGTKYDQKIMSIYHDVLEA